MTAITGSRPAQAAPLTLSARNCEALVGMSWKWCTTFARAHGVRILRVSERKQLLPAAEFFAAIEKEAARLGASATPLTDEQEREAMRRELGMERAS